MKFQITENFGCGSFGFHYIESAPIEEEVCNLAIEKVKESYQQNNSLSFFGVKPPQPLLKIAEYDDVRKKKVRGGIKFQTKWR